MVPSVELGLHLDPHEFCVGIRWWLGLDISRGLSCSLCPNTALDLLGHHAVTCKKGGDVVTRHNRLRDVFVDFCHQAHLGVHVEVGSNLTPDPAQLMFWFVIGLLADLLPLISQCLPPSLLPHLIKHASHQALQLYQPKPASTRLMIPSAVS